MHQSVEMELGGKKLIIETGELAKQANGAVLISYNETVALVTAVASKEPVKGKDFFPLMCEYREKTYAAGKIPGGFFKREGRPSEKEILTSRLMDRPIRPLFEDGFANDTQVICYPLSHDKENDPDILGILGASAALIISDIPFLNPIGAVRVGRVEGKFICNPTYDQLNESDLNLVVAGTKDAIVMVEGEANELSEHEMVEALMFGHEEIKKLVDLQNKLREIAGKPKRVAEKPQKNEDLIEKVTRSAKEKLTDALFIKEKIAMYDAVSAIGKETISEIGSEEDEGLNKEIKAILAGLEKEIVRHHIIEKETRSDGRGLKDIRTISGRVKALPRTHGSSLFTRGETQALVVLTLGTSSDEQIMDRLEGRTKKSFMLHYNFPPFSVGETKFIGSPGRREIGHGALAERSISKVLPSNEEFPYTIRIVSDILESNGSSSMATVCGSSLSLMDAGVPIKTPVAGIAMGLIKEGDKIAILSDILGQEDHLGDMDFKVAGTAEGITGLQMDIKIDGVTKDLLETALQQAKEGRLFILGKMNEIIDSSRKELSPYAPRIITMQIKTERIKDVIGPGGKTIRGIIDKTGVTVDIDDKGLVSLGSPDESRLNEAIQIIEGLTQSPEKGCIYTGIVKKIMDFGAFVEILPGIDGLVHISQIAPHRIDKVTDVLKEGDEVKVKVLEIDRDGKIRLSRKEALSAEVNKK
ncbi:MAG: polyribonucleotide nucleotidyltransferase [Nitrospinota bacterium]|jgi:polyribonucleotide nucleotidyltransferase|nr:polyribonucleotide nucleotidyltransferase [Nitrospinota bacterium]MDP7579984.1 polyribonucleotide nucleotidyltransferase [Nitrospinota bacterium]HJN03233.1 polyribonucleotide nucleotidyltransferase [Nitrospinota bacterium]